MEELKKNSLIVRASAGDDDQIYATASRVIQLQLQASKCERSLVSPNSMKAVKDYVFTITSNNCVVKNKITEACDSGFEARNLSANVNNPDDVIVGENLYKVCLKTGGGDKPAGEVPRPEKR